MLDRILLPETPNSKSGYYTVMLAPGVVRYLDFTVFCDAEIETVLAEFRAASSNPTINRPYQGFKHPDYMAPFGTCVDIDDVDKLLPNASWAERLSIHHALGRLMIHELMPSSLYVTFHRRLQLGTHFAIAECVEAWVKGTFKDGNLAKSYLPSAEHIVIELSRTGYGVFKKTPFVQSRLDSIADDESRKAEDAARRAEQACLEADARRTDVQAEILRRSSFTTFVYVMEDTRNGAFKIGHSRTPGKRERTLQSEVPETALRFSIPANEEHEKALHARFAHRRIRGEWFELSAQDLVDVVSFLKAHGDAERVEADFHWLGVLFFRAE